MSSSLSDLLRDDIAQRSDVPIRDPDRVVLIKHAIDKMKQRNITATEIKNAIKTGSLEEDPTDEEGTNLRYRLEMPVDLLVAVDQVEEEVVTVFYDDDQGAVRGNI